MTSLDREIPVVRERLYKRAFDLAVLTAAHVLLAPFWVMLWTVIPLAIKLQDGGPVFYSQDRVGRGGRVFRVRKFRSMIVDAEKVTGAVWARGRDPRVTRVGRMLRHTALDELPQVINMWRGEMSIVGPRPERPELHEEFVQRLPGYDRRLSVRPGLTGMAQVYGKYDSTPEEKLPLDLEYAGRMSAWLDVKLIVLSVVNTLTAKWDHPSDQAGKGSDEAGTEESKAA